MHTSISKAKRKRIKCKKTLANICVIIYTIDVRRRHMEKIAAMIQATLGIIEALVGISAILMWIADHRRD